MKKYKDLSVFVGRRFGRLTITGSKTVVWPSGRTRRVCTTVCDCGKDGPSHPINVFLKGRTGSCGCLRAEICRKLGQASKDNRIGRVFGDYEVVGECENSSSFVKAKCLRCGTIRNLQYCYLKNRGHTKGQHNCCREYAWMKAGFSHPAHLNAWDSYQGSASQRGLEFKLTSFEFDSLVIQSCVYCGRPASPGEGRNGIDRVDNTIGYVLTNCVPSCIDCNRAKNISTVEQFETWIARLVAFRNTRTAASPAA